MASSRLHSIFGIQNITLKLPNHTLSTLDDYIQSNKDLVAIGLFYSAHWCGPCRKFTPKLINFYEQINKTTKKFEVIFISSDTNEKNFESNCATMPWLSLPFGEDYVDIRKNLKKKFKVQGIPHLVILEPDGKLVTEGGRECVMSDPEGVDFPWFAKSFWDIVKENDGMIMKNMYEEVSVVKLKEETDVIGLYFSAHWCPPCRNFTPLLVETYEKLKSSNKKFEILFCSADHDQESFKQYFDTMPWLTFPLNDNRIRELKRRYKVSGYPRLVMVESATGNTICDDGKQRVEEDKEGINFPWASAPLLNINDIGNHLNDGTYLIVLDPKMKDKDIEVLSKLACKYHTEWKNKDTQPLHFVYGTNGQMFNRLNEFLNLPSDQHPLIIVMDVSAQNKYVVCREVKEENIVNIVNDFLDQKLIFQDLKSYFVNN